MLEKIKQAIRDEVLSIPRWELDSEESTRITQLMVYRYPEYISKQPIEESIELELYATELITKRINNEEI